MAEIVTALTVIGYIQQVYELIYKAVDVYKGIKNAPAAIHEITAETECLVTALHAFTYPQCGKALEAASPEQCKDLQTILDGCKLNMTELLSFVREVQWIVAASDPNTQRKLKRKRGRVKRVIDWGKLNWAKFNFHQTDKQPMRNKLSIPLHSLNVFLVSLTFISTPLHAGPTSIAPKTWTLTGRIVAFKQANFTKADLTRPGVEEKILEAATRIIGGLRCVGHCCPCCTCEGTNCHCADEEEDSGISRPARRRGSTNKERVTSDKMFYVRSKSKQRARSKSVVRVKREVVTPDSDDMDDDLVDSDGLYSPTQPVRGYLTLPLASPGGGSSGSGGRGGRPSGGGGGGGGGGAGGGPSGGDGRRSTGSRRRRRHSARRHRNSSHYVPTTREEAKQEARKNAKREIKAIKRQSTHQLERGVSMTAPELDDDDSDSSHEMETMGDVRTYMEIRYGIVVDRATREEQRIAAMVNNIQLNEPAPLPSVNRLSSFGRADECVYQEFELHHSSDSAANSDSEFYSSDTSESDSDSDPGPDPDKHHHHYASEKIDSRCRKEARRCSMFSIPYTPYTPVTPSVRLRSTTTQRSDEDTRREQLNRERQRDLDELERQLRRREQTLHADEIEIINQGNERTMKHERSRPQHVDTPYIVESTPKSRPTSHIRRRHSEIPNIRVSPYKDGPTSEVLLHSPQPPSPTPTPEQQRFLVELEKRNARLSRQYSHDHAPSSSRPNNNPPPPTPEQQRFQIELEKRNARLSRQHSHDPSFSFQSPSKAKKHPDPSPTPDIRIYESPREELHRQKRARSVSERPVAESSNAAAVWVLVMFLRPYVEDGSVGRGSVVESEDSRERGEGKGKGRERRGNDFRLG